MVSLHPDESKLNRLAAVLERQERELRSLRAALHRLVSSRPTGAAIRDEQDEASMESDFGTGTDNVVPVRSGTLRRSLLKGAGAGAAAIVGAGLLAARDTLDGTAGRAEAATGSSLVIGQTNTGGGTTTLQPDIGTNPTVLLSIDNHTSTSTGPASAAVQGVGPAKSNGLIGESDGDTGYGVLGQTDQGYGVVGSSGSGIDLFTAGTGRFLQRPQGFTGAPSSGSYAIGEQLRDAAGDLWLCLQGGTPGIWRKVFVTPAPPPGYSGGAIYLLAAPIRLLDTRNPPIGAPYQAWSTHSLLVTGVAVGGISVPAGARGVIGNLAVTNCQGGGYVTLFPADAPQRPNASTINYAAGVTIANGAVIGLSPAGLLSIYVAASATDVIFDASGFVF